MQSLAELLSDMKSEFPDFSVVPKVQSSMMKAIGQFLRIVSFGNAASFMDSYVTTIGHTVYVPSGWDSWDEKSRVVLLRHERVHMRQQKEFGKFLFAFIYLIPIFPLFFAWGRTRLEMEAYTETIKADLEAHGTAKVWSQQYNDWLVSQFTGPGYLWMWCFSGYIKKWVTTTITKCIDDFVGYKPKVK